jgi:hypothetical protein
MNTNQDRMNMSRLMQYSLPCDICLFILLVTQSRQRRFYIYIHIQKKTK